MHSLNLEFRGFTNKENTMARGYFSVWVQRKHFRYGVSKNYFKLCTSVFNTKEVKCEIYSTWLVMKLKE